MWVMTSHKDEGRPSTRYGEHQRPELRLRGLLIDTQVAHAPRTVTSDALQFPASSRKRKISNQVDAGRMRGPKNSPLPLTFYPSPIDILPEPPDTPVEDLLEALCLRKTKLENKPVSTCSRARSTC